ncbi:HtaA domain-containing protein [Phenylobacterium sp.]|uniref:HtaA domain-containing protein n=1 Tax=Phenylobacterium sp. TaxID=1871053 RepID=UPI00286BAD24|nr:HtaA domain-containing protein [Phenylobacterium sp.]
MATLSWGVKQSFRSYVEAAGGTVATTGGAERAPDGGFLFPEGPQSTLAQGADGRLRGAGRFQGEVSFNAHGGMLSVVLVDPWIEASEAGLILTVADSPAATRRLPFAKLDANAMTTEALTTGALTTSGGLVLPAAITLDGMFLLGDHYPPGTVLDPVRLLGLAGRV